MEKSLADDITKRLQSEPVLNTPTLHRIRREYSKIIRNFDGEQVIALAHELVESHAAPGTRMLACGLVGNHPVAIKKLTPKALERLAGELAGWGDVDMFSCLVAGIAWRDGQVTDKTIFRWADSTDRWWRRAALASTVPLNVKSQGGAGDAPRTLAVCEKLIDDRDDMVVKAMSWALRELATRDPKSVKAFLITHKDWLAARVLREVRNKLETGLKNPKTKKASGDSSRSAGR